MRPTGFDGSPELKVFFENYAKAPNDDSPPPMAPIILTNDDSPPPAAPILPNLSAVLEGAAGARGGHTLLWTRLVRI